MGSQTFRSLEIFSALYIGDYFTDTLELSSGEHSAFRLLLLRLWLTGAIPVQDAEFALALAMPIGDCGAVRRSLGPLLAIAASNIEIWKAAADRFDGVRLPSEYWRVARAVVLERDGYICAYCGSQDRLHVDHKIPINQGGSNRFENLATLCGPCNLSKGPKSPEQWAPLPSDTLPTPPKIWENGRPYKVNNADRLKDPAMTIQSAGILLYRKRSSGVEVLLVHMGGPLWAKKDEQAWSIPKGVIEATEDPLAAAKREFFEETGFQVSGPYEPLGTFRQNGKKDLTVWALEGDVEPSELKSNSFSMIWPPGSGHHREFAEANRAAWFPKAEAMIKVVKGQQKVLQRLYGDNGGKNE